MKYYIKWIDYLVAVGLGVLWGFEFEAFVIGFLAIAIFKSK